MVDARAVGIAYMLILLAQACPFSFFTTDSACNAAIVRNIPLYNLIKATTVDYGSKAI